MHIFFVLLIFAADAGFFPEERGLCFTPSVKLTLLNVNWNSVREENARIRRSLSSEYVFDRVAVGDTKTFWSWNLSVMPPQWIQVPATCRAVGDSCYIFVADDQWNVHMTQENVDTVLLHFEHHTPAYPTKGIVQLDVEHFGEIPDEIDNDRHVYIFYSALGSYNGIAFDGYFSAYNQMTDSLAQIYGAHSNEVEMFYMTCHPLPPAAPQRLSVLAHELQHMIHWNADEDEEIWVDEGCAEVAMWLYGLPDEISGFPSNPDNNLLNWGQQWSDYIQTYLFMMFVMEHYGGAQTLKNIVSDTLNSVSGIENALSYSGYPGTDFNSLFTDWTVANFLDDTIYCGGKFGYFLLDIPPFARTYHSSYPVNAAGKTVDPWGTDYILFSGGNELTYVFDGADNTAFGIGVVLISNETDSVFFPEPDSNNSFELYLGEFGSQFDNVLVSVSRTCSLGSNSYSYWADVSTGVEIYPVSDDFFFFSSFFDLFSSHLKINFSFGKTGSLSLKVYDCSGREIAQKEHLVSDPGEVSVQMFLPEIPQGMYFLWVNFSGCLKKDNFAVFR
ncbi:hypothetical protein JW890_00455 [candidate division WOR-3 bacterium]|nr:hypothetical protein [candidate division WOR-3 bacterium]